jgi:hypothetical protein
MSRIEEFIDAARASGAEVWVSGPAKPEEVELLESRLGFALPESYRSFLCTYGAISVHESQVTGIIENDPLSMAGSSLFGETERSQTEQGLPPGLLVVQPDLEAPYCLSAKVGSTEEVPVVCFQVNTRSTRQIATSFEDWLERFVFDAAV